MTLGIGLIGSGYMGKAHALAYTAARSIYGLRDDVSLVSLADVDADIAAAAASSLGFVSSTGDWRQLVADPAVDLVDITTPNVLHEEMVNTALDAGKDVYCEKPLAPTSGTARDLAEKARASGAKTMVGLTYLFCPITELAREIVDAGEIGEVISVRGHHLEDYMADPNTRVAPWRLDAASGDGVVVDLGSHLVSLARHIVGPIESVRGSRRTVVPERYDTTGGVISVDTADEVQAIVQFESGAVGMLEASWMAVGRKMSVAMEVRGTKGTLSFDFERLNEIELYRPSADPSRDGFTRILAGPQHPYYADFLTAPGHQIGFNDLKTIEIKRMIDGLIGNETSPWPDFEEGYQVQRVLDAIGRSAMINAPVEVSEF